MGSKNGLIHFTLIPMGKIVSVYEHFGLRTTFRNELSSWTEVRLYCHLQTAPLYHICPHYLINGTIFGKMLLSTKCVFWFSLQLLPETFLILRRIQRDVIINVRRSSCKVPLFLSDCNKTWIFSTDFRKILKYQTSWNPSNGSRAFQCGQMDRRVDMTKPIVTFRNFVNSPKKNAER